MIKHIIFRRERYSGQTKLCTLNNVYYEYKNLHHLDRHKKIPWIFQNKWIKPPPKVVCPINYNIEDNQQNYPIYRDSNHFKMIFIYFLLTFLTLASSLNNNKVWMLHILHHLHLLAWVASKKLLLVEIPKLILFLQYW